MSRASVPSGMANRTWRGEDGPLIAWALLALSIAIVALGAHYALHVRDRGEKCWHQAPPPPDPSYLEGSDHIRSEPTWLPLGMRCEYRGPETTVVTTANWPLTFITGASVGVLVASVAGIASPRKEEKRPLA